MKRVALVTGGSRGIGASTAKLLGENGYSVCVNYRNRFDEAQSIVSQITSNGGKALSSGLFSCTRGYQKKLK